MAKDQKRRAQNKALKKAGVGMKYKKRQGSQQEWQAKVNEVTKKK